MKKVKIHLFILSFILLANASNAQLAGEDGAFSSRDGIFVYLGPAMVNQENPWNNIISYSIFRKSTNESQWTMLKEIQSPATLAEFEKRLKEALDLMPYPIDPYLLPSEKIWSDLMAADSLQEAWEWTTWLPVRLAIGIYHFDATAREDVTYIYRIRYNGIDDTVIDEFEYSPTYYPREAVFPAIKPEEQLYGEQQLQLSWKMEGIAGIAWAELQRKDNIAGTFTAVNADVSFFGAEEDVYIYTFVDEAPKDRFFAYRIVPVDYFGNRGEASEEVKTGNYNYFMDVRLPDSITAVSSQDPPGIKISWSEISNPLVNSISIFRSPSMDEEFEEIVTLNPGYSGYVDASVIPMTKYFYYLQLNGYDGESSPRSARFFGIFQSENPISPPALQAKGNEDGIPQIHIFPTDSRTAGFRVYRRDHQDPDWVLVSGFIPANDSMVVYRDEDKSLMNGRFYDYASSAESYSNVESSLSEYVTLKYGKEMEVPPPYNLGISAVNGSIGLSWEYINAPYIQGFLVYRKEIGENSPQERKLLNERLLPVYSTYYYDTTANMKIKYEYSVEAIDMFGNRSVEVSMVYSGQTFQDIVPPALQVIRKFDGVELNWEPCYQEGIIKTVVRKRSKDGKEITLTEIQSREPCVYLDLDVSKGDRYIYHVVLETEEGLQIKSNSLMISL